MRLETGGEWVFYAPRGLDDVFGLVLRPHPVLAPREVYEARRRGGGGEWPALTVLPWSG
ncbi:nucleotidyltransferase family protein [Streptomyces griseofuscus]|uniref:nucleotidyltransferase family protein n=1 Tax=Streptomyces griseofuscus TaxID=146922 RepID=UPI003CC831EA